MLRVALILLALHFARPQPGTAAAPQENANAGGVLRKLSIAGFGGSGQTSIQALATDSNGNILVTGPTNAPDFPVKNAAQPVIGDAPPGGTNSDVFVAKLAPDGGTLWATFLGGSGKDTAVALVVDT